MADYQENVSSCLPFYDLTESTKIPPSSFLTAMILDIMAIISS